MASLVELRELIARHCSGGMRQTAIPRVTLTRSDTVEPLAPSHHEASLCIVAEGAKRVTFGSQVIDYRSSGYVVVGLDLPVVTEIYEASRAEPYLAFALAFDAALLADLVAQVKDAGGLCGGEVPAVHVSPLTHELLSPVVRLLRLLDSPRDIPLHGPLIEKEVLYRLLEGEQCQMVRQIALGTGHLSQIGRAISWIRGHYSEPFRIDDVARAANMSQSSLYRYFRAATATSPLDYQKRLRLQEARHRLMAQDSAAANVGFSVGYESPSQFNREYRRLFGLPPARDAERLRKSLTITPDSESSARRPDPASART